MKTLFEITTTGDIQSSKAAVMHRVFVNAFTNENKKSGIADLEQELDMYCNFGKPVARFEKLNETTWVVSNTAGDTEFQMTIAVKN
jgi:hypothetical protein